MQQQCKFEVSGLLHIRPAVLLLLGLGGTDPAFAWTTPRGMGPPDGTFPRRLFARPASAFAANLPPLRATRPSFAVSQDKLVRV